MRKAVVVLGVLSTLALAPSAAEAAALHYWIGAVPQTWNIVPSQRDPISGQTFRPEDTTIGTVLYKRFTRNWGRQMVNRPVVGDNDGIPGPTIRARVGDTVFVHFKNMDTAFNRPHSMHFHAFLYPFPSDGAFIPGISGRGANVLPGRSFTYRLRAIKGSAGAWPYHDHSPSMHDSIAGGMYGMISILRRTSGARSTRTSSPLGQHLGFRTINGRAFIGNTPTFRSRVGESVQWSVMAIGSEHHTFHLHGHRWSAPGGPHRHEDARTGGELPLPDQGGHRRDLALPLPRRGPHGARDAGALQGLSEDQARRRHRCGDGRED